MPSGLTSGLKRFILWDYARGSRQYDVMVVLILAFIFLTPREWFRDQPRIPGANTISMLPGEHSEMYWIDRELLNGVPENERILKVSGILKTGGRTTKPVLRLQPIYDESEKELKGYVAFTNP